MNDFPLKKLIELVNFDRQYLAILRDIEKLQQELHDDNEQMKLCQEGLEKAQKHFKESKKEVEKLELDMKALDDQERDKRKRLDEVANQREYQSLSKEIDQLKKQQHDLEDTLLKTWKDFEQAKNYLNEQQTFCDKKMSDLDVLIKEKMQKVDELKNSLQQHQEMRQEKLEGIQPELLEKYEAMYKQVSDPIVPITDSSCSACFYLLPQQDLMNIKRGKLLQCKECFRFLYYEY